MMNLVPWHHERELLLNLLTDERSRRLMIVSKLISRIQFNDNSVKKTGQIFSMIIWSHASATSRERASQARGLRFMIYDSFWNIVFQNLYYVAIFTCNSSDTRFLTLIQSLGTLQFHSWVGQWLKCNTWRDDPIIGLTAVFDVPDNAFISSDSYNSHSWYWFELGPSVADRLLWLVVLWCWSTAGNCWPTTVRCARCTVEC